MNLRMPTSFRTAVSPVWDSFIVVLLRRTVQELSDDDAAHMAAGVAYYSLFSLFPLMLGLIAILGFVMDPDDIRDKFTEWAVDYLPGTGGLVVDNIDTALSQRGPLTAVAAAGLIWSGSAIFGAIGRSINRAWDVHKDRPIYIAKLRQLGMALSVSVLFLLSVSMTTFAQIVDRLSESFDVAGLHTATEALVAIGLRAVSLLLVFAIFLLLYKAMPNTRTFWRYIWPGAVVAAILFEVAKSLFILYMEQFASYQKVYGSIGTVMAFLLWAYVSAMILILGAEISSEYGRMRQGIARGDSTPLHGNPQVKR